MKRIATMLTAVLVSVTFAHANDAHHKKGAMADGEIRKIDKETKKITIKHGPMPNLDMPGMTMVFQVKDPSMLDSVKPGDKVKFEAEKLGGALTVTKIEMAK